MKSHFRAIFAAIIFCMQALLTAQSILVTPPLVRPWVTSADSGVVYQTWIKNPKRDISGLLFLKQTDSLQWHAVFLTEMGMTIFNLHLTPDSSVYREMSAFLENSKAPELLKKDMEFLMHSRIYGLAARKKNKKYKIKKQKYTFWLDDQQRVRKAKSGRRKVTYAYGASGLPETVHFTHRFTGIKWTIKLVKSESN